MVTVNIHEAKTQLSRLIERAVQGETIVIARAGKPLVKLTALSAPDTPQRLGFLAGQIEVPDDFDRMGEREIAALFGTDG
jgi:prevent-host-death family protein